MSSLFDDLFIFEMANSHQGDVEHGKDIIHEMGKIARKYNIKAAVKLQYRNLDNFIHPDYVGRTDVKHIPRFLSTRLTYDQFCELVDAIRDEGMIAMSTPFDEDGVDWCMDQGLDIIKIASCSSLDWPLLEKAAATRKPLIISTGGKTLSDIDKIYNFFTHKEVEFAFLHCVAEYPAPLDHLQLDFIDRMNRRYRDVIIGYSGHEDPDDNTVPMLAVAKGAKILERHVALPTEQYKINAYSMTPQQADKWVESVLKAKTICATKKENDKYVSQAEIDSLNSLSSGDFYEGLTVTRDYKKNEELHEKKQMSETKQARSVIHDSKGLLYEAGIALGEDFEVELSHHYGMQHFRQTGAIIINVINREYCKKLIIVLPGQKHPTHMHKIKEETFQVLYGDLEVVIDGKEKRLKAGDIQTVLRGSEHSFSSEKGAVFEEISTTHVKNDSYYTDPRIKSLDPMERKTYLKKW